MVIQNLEERGGGRGGGRGVNNVIMVCVKMVNLVIFHLWLSVLTHMASIYANLLEQMKVFT